MNIRDEMNKIYKALVLKQKELISELKKCGDFKFSSGFFNNHYHKNEIGVYIADCFPIPVISIKGLCDIEIDLERISVTSKLEKKNVLIFDFSKINDLTFEIYGVEDYLTDYYAHGNNISDTLHKIESSDEQAFFYPFYFDNSVTGKEICKLIEFLFSHNFFY